MTTPLTDAIEIAKSIERKEGIDEEYNKGIRAMVIALKGLLSKEKEIIDRAFEHGILESVFNQENGETCFNKTFKQ